MCIRKSSGWEVLGISFSNNSSEKKDNFVPVLAVCSAISLFLAKIPVTEGVCLDKRSELKGYDLHFSKHLDFFLR